MTIRARYESICPKCGGLVKPGDSCEWSGKGAKPVHLTPAACAAAQRPVAKPAMAAPELLSVVTFLAAAKQRGLTSPSLMFLAPNGGELNLDLAGSMSREVSRHGCVQVKIGDDWKGRILANGTVEGFKLLNDAALIQTLRNIAADPEAAAKAYAKMKGKCAVCHAKLTDERDGSSVEVGYGPRCAKKMGWTHKPKGKAPVKSVLPAALDAAMTAAEAFTNVFPDYPNEAIQDIDPEYDGHAEVA